MVTGYNNNIVRGAQVVNLIAPCWERLKHDMTGKVELFNTQQTFVLKMIVIYGEYKDY